MVAPVRLRLSRAKGFNLQAHSQATNGLPAVVVARPSRWGNPYKVATAYRDDYCNLPEITAASAVEYYRERIVRAQAAYTSVREMIGDLRGRNLACWCALDAPCHADVLIELAGRIRCDAPADPLAIGAAT